MGIGSGWTISKRTDDSGLAGRMSIGGLCATLLVVAGLAMFNLAAEAAATPTTATLRVKVIPIPVNPRLPHGPSYPGTGNILGAGAAFDGELRIQGTEYGGFPPPLTGVTIFTPAGAKLHPQGFATCPEAILESHEVARCPQRSDFSSNGSAQGVVSFGSTRVHEKLTLQAFFAPNGRIAAYAEGTSPALIEILATADITTAAPAFGQKFSAVVPLVETVPEAPYAVVESVQMTVGPAYKQGKRVVPYITLPRKCPKGGFPARTELSFLIGPPVVIDTRLPCPKR